MNEFVNPQHRGVNLPPGFKDLMDVIEANNTSIAETPVYALHSNRKPSIERHETGGLNQVQEFLGRFLESRSKRVTLVFFLSQNQVAFSLARSDGLAKVLFIFSKDEALLERSVREIVAGFGSDTFSEAAVPLTKHRIVGYSMPENRSKLLEFTIDLLRGAFGVSDDAGLGFMFREE